MSKLNNRGEKQFDDGDFLDKSQDQGMTNFEAINNIEEGCDFPLYCESFQHLLDNGIIPHLQGWYQREAQILIDNEYITKR
jgi:hypothetical protein